MKGSAVYLKNINKIRITGSVFQENGPVYSLLEYSISPFVSYLVNRAITYNDPTDTCIDEFNYLNDCTSSEYAIDFPRIRGALHLSNCQSSFCMTSSDA